MNVGDFVMIINVESIPERYLGYYALVTSATEDILEIELIARVGASGPLKVSAFRSDLLKAGVSLI